MMLSRWQHGSMNKLKKLVLNFHMINRQHCVFYAQPFKAFKAAQTALWLLDNHYVERVNQLQYQFIKIVNQAFCVNIRDYALHFWIHFTFMFEFNLIGSTQKSAILG